MIKIKLEDQKYLFDAIASKMDLFVPADNNGQVNFALYEEGAKVRLDELKTVKSAKDIFFPQSEALYRSNKDLKNLKIEPAQIRKRPFAVFGMKACDVRGMEVLDRVFLSEPVDSFYKARRENGIIVSLACNEPWETCFCKAYGIDCAAPGGDVESFIIEGNIYLRALTEKGEGLLGGITEVLGKGNDETKAGATGMKDGDVGTEGADMTAIENLQAQIRSITDKLPLMRLSLKNWGAETPNDRFDSPLWEKLYKPCLACGTCTFVCPTCQCYDIKDRDEGDSIVRYRCWDSCMYSDFTMMAHGNPRTSQMQRFRQRFMHKLVYFPQNNDGMFSCTGCGRCLDKCPQNLNIVKVVKAFEKEAKANV